MIFKENYLFAKFKDTGLQGSSELKRLIIKSGLKDYKGVKISDLYRRIVNYQIETYGGALGNSYTDNYIGKNELNNRTCSRHQSRKRTFGIEKNSKLERWTVK